MKIQSQYTLFDIAIVASSHDEAMDKFKLKNFSQPITTEDYVADLANRITSLLGIDVLTYTSTTDFVEKLIRYGIMKEVPFPIRG